MGEDAASPFLPRNPDESRAIVPLVASLRTYLACDRSPKETSEALHVHKQTVIYRMRRVEKLTGRRLSRTEDLVGFWLALRALGLLGHGHLGTT